LYLFLYSNDRINNGNLISKKSEIIKTTNWRLASWEEYINDDHALFVYVVVCPLLKLSSIFFLHVIAKLTDGKAIH
jgi:hypothetical protein